MDISIITIFILAVFVGFEIITKVPPTLHTPLMSGSNAISGIAIIGAILATTIGGKVGMWLGFAAVVFAMINVVGGFLVTDRMLKIMKRKAIDILGDETRWEELYDHYPGKRPATVKEVADLCAFLASPLAGYITGTIVTIDGGISARGSVI